MKEKVEWRDIVSIGEVVRLKSGGPKMTTITQRRQAALGWEILAGWFDDKKQYYTNWFNTASLKQV